MKDLGFCCCLRKGHACLSSSYLQN